MLQRSGKEVIIEAYLLNVPDVCFQREVLDPVFCKLADVYLHVSLYLRDTTSVVAYPWRCIELQSKYSLLKQKTRSGQILRILVKKLRALVSLSRLISFDRFSLLGPVPLAILG